MDIDRISDLLLKSLSGSIDAEEQQALDTWRKEDPANEETWKTLSDSARLQEEYRIWRSVGTDSPRDAMRHRIRMLNRKRRIALIAASAAILLLLLATSLVALHRSERRFKDLYATYQTQQYMNSIHPGQTRAKLMTDDGRVVVLGSDATDNDAAFRTVMADENEKSRKEKADRIAINKLEIPRGGEFHITLEDGTEVWLNAESSLRYPEHFDGNRREVDLTGEAYFKVAREDARPFQVRIAGQLIRVYGTEFNVMSYEEDQYVYTTLVEGSISICPDNVRSSELILTPGHQAVSAKSDFSTSVQQVKPEVVTSWRNGMFVFENQTLDQIMRQLSRWYDFSYGFVNDDVANTVFMGRMPRYGTFGEVLDILEKSGNLSFRADGNKILISRNN
ncbi:MAG: FecR domain-containing protein [Bacteroidales bacterium]|nr:FecR domain-containing protein [Bacteroidales bacterium]